MKTILTIAIILLMGCNSINTSKQMNSLPPLPDELQVGQNVLSSDSLPAISFPTITEDQRSMLHLRAGLVVPDSTKLIGVREIDGKCTLEAYWVPLSDDPNDFKVYLITRSSDGYGIECIDLGKFHISEHQGPMRFGGNRFYTLDTSVTFDGKTRITVHRTLALTSIYLKDHSLTQLWRVDWDDHYKIDNKGHFTLISQTETLREGSPDEETVNQYKSHASFTKN